MDRTVEIINVILDVSLMLIAIAYLAGCWPLVNQLRALAA